MAPAAAVYAGIYILTLIDAFVGADSVGVAAVCGLALFVVLEARHVHAMHGAAAALLGACGLAAAFWAGGLTASGHAAFEGFHRALPFLVLFAAVMTLQGPAMASPSFRAIGESVVRQPPGRRFLMLAFAGHYLGSVLNLAGLQLVTSLFGADMDTPLRQRLTIAVLRGFSTAVLWSPFFVGMGVILTVVPEASWLTVAPAGLPLGAALIALAWVYDRAIRRPRAATPTSAAAGASEHAAAHTPAGPDGGWLRPARGAAAVFLALAVPVIALSEGGGVSIVIALGLVAPPLALAWQARLKASGVTQTRPAGVLRDVIVRLPDLRNEAVLFLGATLFGVGLSGAVDADALARLGAGDHVALWAKVPLLATAGTLVAGLGVHPVVIAIVAGAVLPPEVLGMSPSAIALLLAVIWGLGTQMSPFSATVMQVARQLDVSVFRVAWLWNAPFCLPAAALAGLAVAGAGGLGVM